MLGHGTIASTVASWWGKIRPQAVRRDKSPSHDPMFIDVMSDFSRKLGERAARQSAGGLAAAQQARREALRAHDRARRRQQVLTAGVAVGALIALGIASLAPPVPPPVAAPSLAAPPTLAGPPVEPAPPVMVAAAEPTILDATPPAAPTPEPSPPNAAAPDAASTEPLVAEEVRELQKRLQGFGFNPGPADGIAGRMTANAVMSYQQSRGQPQTGEADRDLLDQLRQDPAHQVAQAVPPPRPAPRARTQVTARRDTPFDRLGRWLDSLVR